MRAALAAAVALAAGLAGCGPEATPAAPTREYVTYLAESEEVANAFRPYLPSVEATFGVKTRLRVQAVEHGGGESVAADAVLDGLAPRVQPDEVAVVALLAGSVTGGGEALYGRGREESRVAVIGLGGLQHTGLKRGGAGGGARRVRVLLHETGHAVGRAHCDDPWCLMAEADGPEALDRTALVPCEICLASYAAAHPPLKPATIRAAAAKAAEVHGWSIDPPSKKSFDGERSE